MQSTNHKPPTRLLGQLTELTTRIEQGKSRVKAINSSLKNLKKQKTELERQVKATEKE